jgi:hypothetical protein
VGVYLRYAWGTAAGPSRVLGVVSSIEWQGDVMRARRLLVCAVVAVASVAALCLFPAAPAAALSFAPPVHYDLDGAPADLATADLDGDGLPDLVASAGDSIAVLLGCGLGRFAPATLISLGHEAGAIALADVDGNGTVDVVTANGDGTVVVLSGDGDGGFVLGSAVATGTSPSDVVVGDLSADGVPDVATADGLGLSILVGDGAGGLYAPAHLTVGEGCRRLVAGDLDLDGVLDLAFIRNLWDHYSGFGVLLGDGAGGFSPLVTYDTYLEPGDLALCDLSADGLLDLVTTDQLEGDAEVSAFLGDGTGVLTYTSRTLFSRDLSASGLAVADLNRDGRDDVVSTGYRPGYVIDGVTVPPGPPRIYVMLASSQDGVLLAPTSFLAGRLPGEVIAADLNGDRKPDLATTDVDTESLSVRMNGVLPRLITLRPRLARIGDVVTLTGRRFGSGGVVYFGDTPATDYLRWGEFRIMVRVPEGTTVGSVKVTVQTIIGRSAPRAFTCL